MFIRGVPHKPKKGVNVAPKGCPINFPGKCRRCPLPPWTRIRMCSIYRGQVAAGVPWHWRADRRWFGLLPQGMEHPLAHEARKLRMLERTFRGSAVRRLSL